MNYYNEIKNELIDSEVYKKINFRFRKKIYKK